MKKILIAIVAIIIGVGWYWYDALRQVPVVAPINTNDLPYAIETLNNHVRTGTIRIDKELPEKATYKSYIVSYDSEGAKLYALMNIPKGIMPEGGWPVVIVNHGHIPPTQYSTIDSYRNTAAYYASEGFLVLKPDYRGHDKSEGTPIQFISRGQYAVDVLNLMAAIDSIPETNSSKIFLYGHSMGADVSLQVAEVSDKIKGVTLWAPAVTSYPLGITYFGKSHGPAVTGTESYQETLKNTLNKYTTKELSSLENINKIKVPIIIQHSQTDGSVPFAWGKKLYDDLKDQGKNVVLYDYPDDDHDISGHWPEALGRDVKFFKGLM